MTRQTAVIALTVAAIAACCAGCATTSDYMLTEATVLQPCAWKSDLDPQRASLSALVQAMQDNRWRIIQGDADAGYVRAEACRHTTCLSVDAYVNRVGVIEIYRSPGQSFSNNHGQLLESWMFKLRKRFDRYRCDPESFAETPVDRMYLPKESVPPKPR